MKYKLREPRRKIQKSRPKSPSLRVKEQGEAPRGEVEETLAENAPLVPLTPGPLVPQTAIADVQVPEAVLAALGAKDSRIPAGISEEEKLIAEYARRRIVHVAAGAVNSKKGAAALKAAQHLRDEICGPLVREVKVSGGITLEMAVAQAAARVVTVAAKVLPAGSPP